MPDDGTQNKDTAAAGADLSANPKGDDTKQNQQDDTKGGGSSSAKTFTEDEVNARIEKARADEKSKVFGTVEKLQKEKDELAKRIDTEAKKKDEIKGQLSEVQSDLEKVREGKTSELESVNKELSALREQNKKFEAAIEDVASTAAKQVVEAEKKIADTQLDAYKATSVAKAGIQLTELVTGTTPEEIDASIKQVAAKEEKLRESIKSDVRKELAKDLPQPLAVDGTKGVDPNLGTVQSRVNTAKLRNEDEYQKRRAQLLQDAKAKVGGL